MHFKTPLSDQLILNVGLITAQFAKVDTAKKRTNFAFNLQPF